MKRILVTEDEEHILRSVAFILHRAGFRVVRATNGNETLQAIQQSIQEKDPFDLLLCDVWLPGTTGVQIIKTLHAQNIRIPFISMTGLIDEKIGKELKDLGCGYFLTKPFEREDLLNAVHEVLQLPTRADTATNHIPLIVDQPLAVSA